MALAIFIVSALTTSQAAALAAIIPIGLTLGIPPQFLAAYSTACIGIYFFPANGSQITSIATDETGTTHISKYAIWHSFSLPMFVMWLVGMVVALIVAIAVYGTSAREPFGAVQAGDAVVRFRSHSGCCDPGTHRRLCSGSGRLRRVHPERDLHRADRRCARRAGWSR